MPKSDMDPEEAPSAAICNICTEVAEWYAVGECNHRVCHICCLRLRGLYKTNLCPMCKTDQKRVIITKSADLDFQEYDLGNFQFDKKLRIYFETDDIYDETMILLQLNCPDPECDASCPSGWIELKRHVKSKHGLFMCDICIKHKKVFSHEHILFTPANLRNHCKRGDAEDSSFKGHPECGFCKISFYDTDALYEHCKQHETCFLCQRHGIRHQYHEDYVALEVHFKTEHFLCLEKLCLEKKFVVFDSDIDFKGHQIEVHNASKRGMQLDLQFQYRANSAEENQVSNNRKGRNQNRENGFSKRINTELTPQANNNNTRNQGPPVTIPPLASSVELSVTAAEEKNPFPSLGGASSNGKIAKKVIPAYKPTNQYPPLSSTASLAAKSISAPSKRLKPPSGFGTELSQNKFSSAFQKKLVIDKPILGAAPLEISRKNAKPEDPELMAGLVLLFDSDKSRLVQFKSLASAFLNSHITVLELITSFAQLVLNSDSGPINEFEKHVVENMAKVWKKLAASIPATSNANNNTSDGKKKTQEMLNAWNDFKVSQNCYFTAPIISNAAPYALESNASSATSNSVSKQRVLVIKSNASKNRFTKRAAGTKNLNFDKIAQQVIESTQTDSRNVGGSNDDFPSLKGLAHRSGGEALGTNSAVWVAEGTETYSHPPPPAAINAKRNKKGIPLFRIGL